MYDELVKQLRFCASTDVSESLYPCDGCSYDNPNDYGLGNAWNVLGCSARMMLQAADAIEKLTEDNAALNGTVSNLIQQIAELSKPRWIPVTERLPENDCNCIVFSDGYVKEAHFYFGKFYDPIEDYMRYKATHWMPLPEPPKGE